MKLHHPVPIHFLYPNILVPLSTLLQIMKEEVYFSFLFYCYLSKKQKHWNTSQVKYVR